MYKNDQHLTIARESRICEMPSMHTLRGIIGILIVLLAAYLLSNNKSRIRWRPVLGGLMIQLTLAFVVLRWETGREGLLSLTRGVQQVIDASQEGIGFMFGPLASNESMGEVFGNHLAFVFAFRVLPLIIFFASLISVLYYVGIMQVLVKWIGGGLQKLLGTSKPESMAAAANIFVGQSEAPLVIRPYLKTLTSSGLFTVVVGGLASVAGSMLGGYAALGVPLEYLLAACFMSAPAGLAMAKLMFPEVERSEQDTGEEDPGDIRGDTANVVDAAAKGAGDGLIMALNIGAMLMAFISLIALCNLLLGLLANQSSTQQALALGVGLLLIGSGSYVWKTKTRQSSTPWLVAGVTLALMAMSGYYGGVTLQQVFGWIFSPAAWAIGIPWSEAQTGGNFIGQKLVLNEFVAYASFVGEMETLSPKTNLIISFALCGFANLGSMAVNLGTYAKLAPERRAEVARLLPKAVAAGMFASFLSASMAGMFFVG